MSHRLDERSMLELGKFLAQMRKEKNFSQKQIADYLGLRSPQFISNWERGIATPPMHSSIEISDMLDIGTSEFANLVGRQTEETILRAFRKRIKKHLI